MTNEAASSPRDAVDVLRQVESIRRQTRTHLQAFWFPLVVFGAITLASAAVQLASSGAAVGIFWGVTAPLGGIAVGRFYRSRELRIGVGRPPAPYIVTAVGLFAGAFLLPMFTTGDLQEVVSTFAVAAAYLVFVWLERSPSLAAALAGVLAAVPVLVLVSGVGHPGAVTAAVTGAAILVTGLVSRRSS